MKVFRHVFLFVALFASFAFSSYSQEATLDLANADGPGKSSLAAISSTGTGGLWSSPATWAGGVVPGAGDDVTIIGGSAVVIDGDITVASVTVGDSALNPAVLLFDPFTARLFTVNGNLTVSSGGNIFTTPSSSTITGHTVTIGGNVTNNGIIDLSTNGNLSGAGLVFTGAANSTFSGSGSTDIRTITVDKGTAITSTLEFISSDFSVQGSTTDTAASGYLTLLNGTFKLSGAFIGNYRTFPTAAYSIPATAGFWLNNANYTVAAQNGNVSVAGLLQVSAGTYNVGTAATDIIEVVPTGVTTGGSIIVDNGAVNVSGAMRTVTSLNGSYRQNGGTVTTCMAGNFAPCFNMRAGGTGGKLVIQTPAAVPNDANPDYAGGSLQTTYLTLGNANTPGAGTFTVSTFGQNGLSEFSLAIDTTAGAHTVRVSRGMNAFNLNDLNIGPGGTLDTLDNDRLYLVGDSYINNGTIRTSPTIDFRVTSSISGNPVGHVDFSGSGSFAGPVGQIAVFRRNLTLGGSLNLRTGFVYAQEATIFNASRITLGNNDSTLSTISLAKDGFIDSAPTFDLGTGGQQLVYSGIETSRTIGAELNPARSLAGLSVASSTAGSVLNVTGGDLTVNGPIAYVNVIDMGSNKLRHLSGAISPCVGTTRYVRGGMVRRFSTANENYTFPVGISRCMAAKVTATDLPSGTADVELTSNASAMSGMPANSVPFTWNIQQTGAMTSSLELIYGSSSWPGNEFDYRAYRSTGGGPPQVMIMGSSVNTSADTITIPSSTDLTASWGVGQRPPRIFVNISGTVYGPNGAPLRNAIVRLQGGEMQTPKLVYTGSLGTYAFEGVMGPELEYTLTASAKRYRFANANVTITPSANVTGLDFIANPPSKAGSGLK